MFGISRSALTLFGFELRWYGVLIALGVLGAVIVAHRREARLGLPKDTALDLALVGVPAAVVCARVYYVLFSWEYYAAHPGDILNIRQGGLAIYGGVLGGVLAGWIYCRVKKLSFPCCLDLAAPALALGQAVGRWGNFLNQEAYGRAVTDPRLQFFPLAVYIEGSGWHWATFFYESLWCVLIVVFLLAVEKRGFFRRRGDTFGAYLFLYALERTLVEGLRTDSLYLGPLRVSQALSLAALLAVGLVLARRARGLPALVRALPALTALLLGAAVALDAGLLSAVFALILLGFAVVVYIGSETPGRARQP